MVEKEEIPECRLGELVVDGKRIPVAVCQLGEKIDIRIPDKTMLKTLFDEKIKEASNE